jgi:hypothetical protein
VGIPSRVRFGLFLSRVWNSRAAGHSWRVVCAKRALAMLGVRWHLLAHARRELACAQRVGGCLKQPLAHGASDGDAFTRVRQIRQPRVP